MKPLVELTRPNIWNLKPYSSARDEFKEGNAHVFLDANENPYNIPYNRYPDPNQTTLKARISQIKGIGVDNIFLGNGSDEAIDLAYRCFTRPGIDNVVAIEPTYGMYKVCADINDVEYRPVLLDDKFQISADTLLNACDDKTKLIWICSPNNPTGNNIRRDEIVRTIRSFEGLVVVDEAYSDFSAEKPLRPEINEYPNLIVLNTFSKAWGCAAIRLGMAFADKAIIDIFNKVKYPYNVNSQTQSIALNALKDPYVVDRWVKTILLERVRMVDAFNMLPCCKRVYPSDANFLLVKFDNAQAVYEFLKDAGIIVRNRTHVMLCGDCLRITIGSKGENNALLSALRQY